MNSISKYMTDEEIINSYKNRMNKSKEQIAVISQLAAVDKGEVIRFLCNRGCLDGTTISMYIRHGVLTEEDMAKRLNKTAEKSKIPQIEEETNVLPAVQREIKVTGLPDNIEAIIVKWLDENSQEYEKSKKIVAEYDEVMNFMLKGV